MNVGKQHGVLKNAGSLEMPLVYGKWTHRLMPASLRWRFILHAPYMLQPYFIKESWIKFFMSIPDSHR